MDPITGETRRFEDQRFDFEKAISVIVYNELYVFKASKSDPVKVYKYKGFTRAETLVKTTLSNLPHDQALRFFSTCNLANKSIVLTGGYDSRDKATAKTQLIDIIKQEWQSLPDLNVKRGFHSSCTSVAGHIFVTSGKDSQIGVYLNSVEMLRPGEQAWSLIDVPDFKHRGLPIFH